MKALGSSDTSVNLYQALRRQIAELFVVTTLLPLGVGVNNQPGKWGSNEHTALRVFCPPRNVHGKCNYESTANGSCGNSYERDTAALVVANGPSSDHGVSTPPQLGSDLVTTFKTFRSCSCDNLGPRTNVVFSVRQQLDFQILFGHKKVITYLCTVTHPRTYKVGTQHTTCTHFSLLPAQTDRLHHLLAHECCLARTCNSLLPSRIHRLCELPALPFVAIRHRYHERSRSPVNPLKGKSRSNQALGRARAVSGPNENGSGTTPVSVREYGGSRVVFRNVVFYLQGDAC